MAIRRAVLLLVLFLAAQIGTAANGDGLVLAANAEDEIVAFNTKSYKYHCVRCSAAKRCTKNCIDIQRSEAKARGGVACKICGGTCDR